MSSDVNTERYSIVSSVSTTLVMLSGGIDSTAALWHTLNNIDKYDKVHVHHVRIYNIEGRAEAESRAVERIYDYLRRNLSVDFKTSESSIKTPGFNGNFLYDTEITGFMTGYMTSRDSSIARVVLGVTGDDWADVTVADAAVRSRASHNAFHRDMDDHSATVKIFPHKDLTKQEVYDSMPPALARLTWSCRRPHYESDTFIECGACKTCVSQLQSLVRAPHGEDGV